MFYIFCFLFSPKNPHGMEFLELTEYFTLLYLKFYIIVLYITKIKYYYICEQLLRMTEGYRELVRGVGVRLGSTLMCLRTQKIKPKSVIGRHLPHFLQNLTLPLNLWKFFKFSVNICSTKMLPC